MLASTVPLDLDGPAMAPPEGQVSDLDNNGGLHELGEAAIVICAILATVSVILRVWSRLAMKPRLFGIEEALLVCALGTFSGFVYIAYKIAIFPGFFVHEWNVRVRDISNYAWRVHFASVFYCLTLMLLKAAILVDWAHLFNPLKKRNSMFWAVRILLVMNTVYYITAAFLETFRCTPQQKVWDIFYKGGYCPVNVVVLNLVASIINLVSDIAILALPQWVIWRLNMTRATRAGVSVLFLIGIFGVACAICRLFWLSKLLDSRDEIYLAPMAGAFGLGEMTAAFLIIGVPSVPRMIRILSSQGSAVRSLLSRIRLLNRTTRKPTGEEPKGVSMRTLGHPSWNSSAHRKPRGMWDFSDDETFDLLSVSTAHVVADQCLASDMNFPRNAIKRDTRVDIVNERIC